METVPQAYVDADADVIHVTGHGCDVPMTFGEARAIRDELTALLLVHDQPAHLPMVGRELLASAYAETFPDEARGSDEPTVEMGRQIPPHPEDAKPLHRNGNDGRVTWFDTGSGPGWEVRES